MKIEEVELLNEKQKERVLSLWNSEYPIQLQFQDLSALESYFSTLSEPRHYFATDAADEIIGWGFTFKRENEKWFAIIIAGSHHNKGIGSNLLNCIKQNETVLSGWVIEHNGYIKQNQTRYVSPLTFYSKNGFEVFNSEQLKTDKLRAVKIKWSSINKIT